VRPLTASFLSGFGWKKASALNFFFGIGDQALLPSRSISQRLEGFKASLGNWHDISTTAMGTRFEPSVLILAGMVANGVLRLSADMIDDIILVKGTHVETLHTRR
jgi:hypothetical protein